ncbi:MAG: hypothetical protein EA353_04965 [Puniceicoccaceae bacterium]|nr:MAG: hypothetical protein EA353_04965 [Puniceicoccaceae bacterium]
MKKISPIITLLICLTLQLSGDEYIQIKEENGSTKHFRIEGENGSVSSAHELHLGAPESDETNGLYAGYKISYLKHEGKLSLDVISNTFEGFIEFEKDQFSPVMTVDRKKVELLEVDADEIEILLKGRAPIKVKWVTIENSAKL